MTDFTKILDKAKELEAKMKESQEKIKEIRVEGVSGSNSVKIILDGEGEMQNIELSDEIMKEDKNIIEENIHHIAASYQEAIVDTLFVVTKPHSSMQNPAAINATNTPPK